MALFLWACIGVLLYTYGIFPALLRLRLRGRRLSPPTPPAEMPRVAILFAAYNEEAVLASKLDNICALDYPHDRLQVWIGSDASTDATDRIAAEYAARYPFIHAVRFDRRTGKAPILNDLVARTDAEIVVLTDADVLFAPDILRRLVAPLRDPSVGLVSARMIRSTGSDIGFHATEQRFYSGENLLKYAEAVLYGMVMGADGAGYALRRRLYTPFPADRIVTDDLLQTLHVIAQGYRTWYALDAICYTGIPDDPREEFHRKSRVACSNFATLRAIPPVFLRPWTRAGWLFYSHKLLRWLGGFALIGAAIGSWLLAGAHWSYAAAALVLSGILALPLVPTAVLPPLVRHVRHFVAMNYAQVVGFCRWLAGRTVPYWQPPQRNVSAATGSRTA
jgi:cellulose synthase/poly-beta-1,6-N-acetylglucosamine synthase-like glycosyltransferase